MAREMSTGSSSDLSGELQAIFSENDVPDRFVEFLKRFKVTTVMKFASAAATEDKVESSMIQASGIADLDFGERVAIMSAWNAARAQLNGGSAGPSTSAPKKANKMPDGVELMLRAKFRGLHGFPLMGSWMVNEDTMRAIYDGGKVLTCP